MPKTYSVAEARRRLPRLLDEVEHGEQVEITRRGEPVAVVVSVPDFRRLAGEQGGFSKAYRAWRAAEDPADLDLPEDYYQRLRDRSPGRDVAL